MEGLCGTDCSTCKLFNNKCNGCINMKGCPFGKKCFIYKYIEIGGKENYELFKNKLIEEINSLNIDGMGKVSDLYPLNGAFVNLEYTLPNNKKIKYLDDNEIYLGNEIKYELSDDFKKCFGIICNSSFILVSEYEENGINPEIIIYKKR